MDMRRLVGRNFARIRRAQGLTQEQVEERSGHSQQYLSSLERGRRNPTVVTLYELAQALGVTTSSWSSPMARWTSPRRPGAGKPQMRRPANLPLSKAAFQQTRLSVFQARISESANARPGSGGARPSRAAQSALRRDQIRACSPFSVSTRVA